MQDIFWMVSGEGQGGTTHRHHSLDAACTEAKRLSALNPGVIFAVLVAVDAYLVPKSEPVKVEIDPNPLPF